MIFLRPKQVQWWENRLKFTLDGKEYLHFVHQVNCGWPPYRMTERSVEMALADAWLSQYEKDRSLIEIGAVTPYYWPARVADIVDPADQHRMVNIRKSLFDISLCGRKVLSVSTFEHIGTGEYNLERAQDSAFCALDKVMKEAESFLITVPVGYNKELDAFIFDRWQSFPSTKTAFMRRGSGRRDNNWRQVPAGEARSTAYTKSANALIILVRS